MRSKIITIVSTAVSALAARLNSCSCCSITVLTGAVFGRFSCVLLLTTLVPEVGELIGGGVTELSGEVGRSSGADEFFDIIVEGVPPSGVTVWVDIALFF